jgi:hypothetical protein
MLTDVEEVRSLGKQSAPLRESLELAAQTDSLQGQEAPCRPKQLTVTGKWLRQKIGRLPGYRGMMRTFEEAAEEVDSVAEPCARAAVEPVIPKSCLINGKRTGKLSRLFASLRGSF